MKMQKMSFFMMSLMTIGFLAVVGCGKEDDTKDNTDHEDDTSNGDDNTIEIFSWWTSPGEAEALDALIDTYKEEYPDMDVVNLSAELGHGEDAREALAQRMEDQNPPDVFQLGPRDLERWISYNGDADDNRLESLDSLFETEGWTTLYPEGVLEVLQHDGSYYAVPVNMHRQNTLFYNTSILSDTEVPTTMEAFLELAENLNQEGIVPLAVSAGTGGWTLEIIFFSILAGSQGADFHRSFYTGAMDMTDSDNQTAFATAVDNYLTILGYANTDANTLGWDEAAKKVHDGDAAMYIHGDWAKGYYTSLGWEAGVDFKAVAAPGSADTFIYNVDAFSLCEGAPNRANALNFLKVIGSAAAQQAFNIKKGSTPVHPDVDTSGWDDVAADTFQHMEDASILHNVEVNQFSVPGATEDDDDLGMADMLMELFNEEITATEFVDWVVDNYTEATQ